MVIEKTVKVGGITLHYTYDPSTLDLEDLDDIALWETFGNSIELAKQAHPELAHEMDLYGVYLDNEDLCPRDVEVYSPTDVYEAVQAILDDEDAVEELMDGECGEVIDIDLT